MPGNQVAAPANVDLMALIAQAKREKDLGWTSAARVRLLAVLWGTELTAEQIADELGNVTKNAVIGRARRDKLTPKKSGSRAKATVNRAHKRRYNTATSSLTTSDASKAAASSTAGEQTSEIKRSSKALTLEEKDSLINSVGLPASTQGVLDELRKLHCR